MEVGMGYWLSEWGGREWGGGGAGHSDIFI